MLTLKDKIQQNKKTQIKWKIYFSSLLILSNFTVFLITKLEYDNTTSPKLNSKSNSDIHQNFTQLNLKLKSNLTDQSFNPNESRLVYLISTSGDAIIKKAYFIKKLASDSPEDNIFNIEISNDEYIKLVQIKSQDLILIKANQYHQKKTIQLKGDRYEMVF